jgi:hypothetical protein
MDKIKAHEGIYIRFHISHVFKEMNHKIKKYKLYKEEHGLK